MQINCPQCDCRFEAASSAAKVNCPQCNAQLDAEVLGATMALTPEQLRASAQLSASREESSGLDAGEAEGLKEFGGYEIQAELGRGGMGVVYKAFDPKLKRTVALKVLLAAEHASDDEVKRFFREAESAAKLQHPNIVPIHELKVHQGRHYYTMDYIQGQPLDALLGSGKLDLNEKLELLEKVAAGLEHAHSHGIIHRDLKPSNIIVDSFGEPRIFDFGLAKVLNPEGEQPGTGGLTQSGVAMGTPHYMAPEQAAGRSKDVDARTDVYAMGCILYEALTGRPPFVSTNAMEVIRGQLESDPLPPRNTSFKVPTDAETICLKCLAKEPERRYASARELGADIRRFLDGKPISARPASLLYRVRKRVTRNLGVVLTAFAAACLIALLALGWAVYGGDPKPSADDLLRKQRLAANPVKLSAMRSNQGWMVTLQIMNSKVKEIFYRLGEGGEFESTGHMALTNTQTGLPMANMTVNLPLAQKATRIFVKYTDDTGASHGPYALDFDPGLALVKSTKSILRMTSGSWVMLREYDGKLLLYFTHLLSYRGALKEVRYSLDDEKLEEVFPLPPGTGARIPSGATTYLTIPKTTMKVFVKLTYRDDTESKIRSFERK
jgi:tRNA A-37 threonylcarbamoyl transferase component Bud32